MNLQRIVSMTARPCLRFGLAISILALSHCGVIAETPDPLAPQMKLIWSDEFEGDSLDFSKWGIEENAFGGGNNELQIYTDRPENVRVEKGHLVLEARRDHANRCGTEREYSSGRIRTKHRGDWLYGRIEVRAKLPAGRGIWPAIWMLPTDEEYGGWPRSGEIDIMELRGGEPNKVLGTLHYGDPWPNNQHSGDDYTLPKGTFADDFHVFAVDWKRGSIEWSIDGKKVQRQTRWNTGADDFPAPFNRRFHLLLNVAVGGHFVSPVDQTTHFPQQMLVDYVRVYQTVTQPADQAGGKEVTLKAQSNASLEKVHP